jgi:hypothetical protein
VASAFSGQYLKKNFGRFLELMRLGKLGDAPHFFFEAFDRFSRAESALSILEEFQEWNVTPHFVYDEHDGLANPFFKVSKSYVEAQ